MQKNKALKVSGRVEVLANNDELTGPAESESGATTAHRAKHTWNQIALRA